MKESDGAELLRRNPEVYASTGLDWSKPAHYPAIANGLFQVLIMVLAKQQGCRQDAARRDLRRQQARIEQRMSVVERAAWRTKVRLAEPMDHAVLRLALEKMADALEEGAVAWGGSEEFGRNTVLAGTALGVAVGFAAGARGHRAGERFSVGPFGGLSKISQLVARPDVLVEMEDLPALHDLTQMAREIPVAHVVARQNESCVGFYEAFDAVQDKLQKRSQERDWTS